MKKNESKITADQTRPKRKKMALGRGLDALIPGGDREISSGEGNRDYFQCPISHITPNQYQPRKQFSSVELQELADSIREQGVIQPLIVRKSETGYELVAGERRLRASKIAGLQKVPVVLKDLSDAELIEMSIVENLQREDLNPIEEAEAYHQLITEFHLTQDQAAARVGKSRPSVANMLRLRNLPEHIKESIVSGDVSMGHARALLGAENESQQTTAWRKILSKGISVRETENLIKQLKNPKTSKAEKQPNTESIYYSRLAEDLSRHYGTKVAIKRFGKRGAVSIEFYDDDDLERLLQLMQ